MERRDVGLPASARLHRLRRRRRHRRRAGVDGGGGDRTERQHFRSDRMRNILISAMLQSQQSWLPLLHPITPFKQVAEIRNNAQKFIAHCIEDEKRSLGDLVNESLPSQIILIGPEGDFTTDEVQLAIQNHFDAVSLGATRLRAETAGVVAAALLRHV